MRRSLFGVVFVLTSGALYAAACSKTEPTIDWSAKENFFYIEKSEKTPEGARLEFHSIVDAPAKEVYRALTDVENYAKFVDGVSESNLVSEDSHEKVIDIAQTVIGRQAHARVQWTFHPDNLHITFQTLQSDANYNDGSYKIIASPDGKRCYVITTFWVKEKGAPPNVPIGVLQSATRDSFAKAARSIKLRASGKA